MNKGNKAENVSASSAIETFRQSAEKISEDMKNVAAVALTKADVIEPCEADFFEACAKFYKGEIDDIPSYMRQQDEEIRRNKK